MSVLTPEADPDAADRDGAGRIGSLAIAAAGQRATDSVGRLVYLDHFGLRTAPFQLTANPGIFYGGADRGQMLYALWYCLRHSTGITVLTGAEGCGKTQLARMLRPTAPAAVDIVFLGGRALPQAELVPAIADQLGMGIRRAVPAEALRLLTRELERRQTAGRRVVLVLDDAHAMPDTVLRQIPVLGALHNAQRPLLQILLVGHDRFRATLALAAQRDLDDRITHRFRLAPLGEDSVAPYLAFRMQSAGGSPQTFDPAAARMIARGAMGLPNRIHVLADKSLMAAFNDDFPRVMRSHVELALNETALRTVRSPRDGSAAVGKGHALGRLWRRYGLGRVGPE